MIAGVGGPAEEHLAHNRDAAPTDGTGGRQQTAAAADGEELDDGHGPDGVFLEATDEVLPDPVVPDVVTSTKYRRLFGTLPLHTAVLDVFCRMAALGGRLMGDNMAETVQMTEKQMRDLADEAQNFIIEPIAASSWSTTLDCCVGGVLARVCFEGSRLSFYERRDTPRQEFSYSALVIRQRVK